MTTILEQINAGHIGEGLDYFNKVDFFEEDSIGARLRETGCSDFVNGQIDLYVRSSLTNKLGTKTESRRYYLQGAIYGFVLAKTGDKKLSLEASKASLQLALDNKKD
jgi:hypothetical protein